jgi:hypothetical protein
MKTKIELGNSVKTKVSDSLDVSVYSSVCVSMYWLVFSSVRTSINNLMIWRLKL